MVPFAREYRIEVERGPPAHVVLVSKYGSWRDGSVVDAGVVGLMKVAQVAEAEIRPIDTCTDTIALFLPTPVFPLAAAHGRGGAGCSNRGSLRLG
jgi:hypothetical protein